jgi:hypothetical protein
MPGLWCALTPEEDVRWRRSSASAPSGLALPGVVESDAWRGVRWAVAGRTFAHILPIENGRPPVYARAFGTEGPALALTFWSAGPELEALRRAGPPFVAPPWNAAVVGLLVDADTDWTEIAELIADSHRLRAGA